MIKKGLKGAVKTAKRLYKNKKEVKKLLAKADKKTHAESHTIGDDLKSDLKTLMLMLRHWLNGSFKISFKTLIYVIAGIVYFVNPLDLVPDFIFGLGFVDDAAVLALVIRRINKELLRFKKTMQFEKLEVVSQPNES